MLSAPVLRSTRYHWSVLLGTYSNNILYASAMCTTGESAPVSWNVDCLNAMFVEIIYAQGIVEPDMFTSLSIIAVPNRFPVIVDKSAISRFASQL